MGTGVGHSTGRVAGSQVNPLATAAACSSSLHTLPAMARSQHTGFNWTPLPSHSVLQFKTVLALLLRSNRGNWQYQAPSETGGVGAGVALAEGTHSTGFVAALH